MDGVMLLYLALVIAVATQTFKYIEEPGRKLFSPARTPRPKPLSAISPAANAEAEPAVKAA
jgi:peptidoglycan/LPS O-acetylase OafA/YrhL